MNYRLNKIKVARRRSQYRGLIRISSLASLAQRAAEIVRGHPGIENSLHWVLDVAFREADSRIRAENARENFPLIRKRIHHLLNYETTLREGIKTKSLVATWHRQYLLKILNGKASFDGCVNVIVLWGFPGK